MKKNVNWLLTVFFGISLGVSCYGMEDFDFDIPEEEYTPTPPSGGKPTVTREEEESISFDDMQDIVEAESAKQVPEPLVYPPVPENKKPEKKEDPTLTAFRKTAMAAKSITYDLLPEPIKEVLAQYVLDPVANHIKQNFKLKDIEFGREPEVALPNEKGHAFLIIGNLTVYGQEARAIIREMVVPQGGKPTYSLTLEFAQGVKLSTLAKELNIIDLDIKKLRLVFSQVDYEPQDKDLKGIFIKKGFNLVGDVQMTGVLQPVKLLTKLEQLRMFGSLQKGLIGSTLNGVIPGDVSLGGGATLTKMLLGVEVAKDAVLQTPTPQFIIRGDLSMAVKGRKDPVKFSSTLQLAKEKATLSGFMDGLWKDAFGVTGLSIGDIGVGGSVLYAGTLDGVALKGTILFGDKKFDLATKGSVTEGPAFIGSLQGTLSFKDIVNFVNSATKAGLPVDDVFKLIPNLSLKNPTLQIVPVDTLIVGEQYKRGTSFNGAVTILGKETVMNIKVYSDGVKGSAVLPEIHIPLPVKDKGSEDLITIKGVDGNPLALSLNILKSSSKVAEFYCKAFVQLSPLLLGGASANGFINFTQAETDIMITSKIFDQFMFDIDVKSTSAAADLPTNMVVKAKMKADGGINDLTNKIRAQIQKVFGNPEEVEKELTDNTNKCFKAKGFIK